VLLPSVPAASITDADLPAAKQKRPALGAAERPLGPSRWNIITAREPYRAILEDEPYPVRGLIGFGSNMLLSQAEGSRGRDALTALDFYAHADLCMTPTATLADVVLPVASAFEREALKIGFEINAEAQSLVQLRQPVRPPPGEARSDTQIVFDLADRLGLSSHFWDGDIDAAYRHQLAPSKINLETLRSQAEGVRVPRQVRHTKHAESNEQGHLRGFATPSRRIEIYSETFLNHGYSPLPDFVEPVIGPVGRPNLAERFPLVLTCAKPTLFCQSQHRALPSLRRHALDPEVMLHPEAAQARRIAQGDWVSIETPAGSVRARANLNPDIDPRVVVGQHGWWQGCAELDASTYDPFEPKGANYNLLIGGDTVDPISGTASHRAYLCEI
jgi:anaerobic selenocysteine-containing dehydrogenase